MENLTDQIREATKAVNFMREAIKSLDESRLSPEQRNSLDRLSMAAASIDAFIGGLKDLKTLNSRIIKAQEKERKKIANEVHDGPAQNMASVVMQLDILAKTIERAPEKAMAEVEHMKSMIKNSLNDVRRFIFDLRPMSLDDLGLVATLNRYVENTKSRVSFDLTLDLRGRDVPLSKETEITVYRIVQEAVNNARKHAAASLVRIKIEFQTGELRVSIRDNGKGFDVAQIRSSYSTRESLGLISMMERAELLGGLLEVQSASGKGTLVNFRLNTDGGNQK